MSSSWIFIAFGVMWKVYGYQAVSKKHNTYFNVREVSEESTYKATKPNQMIDK